MPGPVDGNRDNRANSAQFQLKLPTGAEIDKSGLTFAFLCLADNELALQNQNTKGFSKALAKLLCDTAEQRLEEYL